MELKTALSSKGQIVIPKTVRDSLGLELGAEFSVYLRADQVIEIRVLKQNIKRFFSKGRRPKQGASSVEEMDQLIQQVVLSND